MLQIPAIEWDEKTTDGTSSIGSNVVASVSDTSLVVAGMVIVSSAFPYNTRVVSKTVDSITLTQNAMAVASSFSFYKRFEFTYPASTDEDEQIRVNQSQAVSLSGIRQKVTNFFEARRSVTFGFIAKTDRDTLRDSFLTTWGLLGRSFKYFNDKAINTSVNYEIDSSDYSQKRQVKKHPDYLYEIPLRFRRVL